MNEINYKELISDIGIEKGDIIDVASALRDFSQYCRSHELIFDANHLLDTLIEAVGAEGTVMIRAFTWDFCKQIPFDILHSPSQVGTLGNVAMERQDFKRTQHPMYSWLVWGKYKEDLCNLNNICAFGMETPFDFLYQNNAKMVRIGNTKEWGLTQRHHAEKLAEVRYRYEKVFEGEYIDSNGMSSIKKYSMYVKNLDMEVELNDYSVVERDWKKMGVMISKKWNNINCCSIMLKQATDYIYDDLIHNFGRKTVIINGESGYQSIV